MFSNTRLIKFIPAAGPRAELCVNTVARSLLETSANVSLHSGSTSRGSTWESDLPVTNAARPSCLTTSSTSTRSTSTGSWAATPARRVARCSATASRPSTTSTRTAASLRTLANFAPLEPRTTGLYQNTRNFVVEHLTFLPKESL